MSFKAVSHEVHSVVWVAIEAIIVTWLVIAHLWPMKELSLSDLRNLVLLLLQKSKPHDTISGGFGGLPAPSWEGGYSSAVAAHFSLYQIKKWRKGEGEDEVRVTELRPAGQDYKP